MKTKTKNQLKKHFLIGCLFIVLTGFSQPFSSTNPIICGDNNVVPIKTEGFSKFSIISATPVSVFIDSDCIIPYVAQIASTLFIKLDITNLDTTSFSINVSATSNTGLLTTQVITGINNTKTWKGTINTDWNDSNNWSPKGVPTPTNCVIVPSRTVISGENFNAFAKNIIVKPTGTFDIAANNNLTVTDWINVYPGGVFNVKNNGSIIQINEDQNIGKINIEKITQPMSYYDYTYWNSPLTSNSNFTFTNLSPQTKSDIWSFKTTIAGGSGNWINELPSTTMLPTKGYIVKAPDTFSINANNKINYTANFIGTPNNGTILTPISKGTNANISEYVKDEDDEWNLIGNPYPSGIDAKKFLEYPSNSSSIEGTIYIWTPNPQPTTAYKDKFYGDYVLNYTTADYASFNKTGGTATASSGTTGYSSPSGYIATASSFFVKASKTMANGTTTNVIFNNSMRTTEYSDEANNSTFKKTLVEEKHRIWLNLTNNSGAFSQTLVGYISGATQELDRGYDGESFGGNDVTFYSIIPQAKLAIQGRALPFDTNDIVTLGYKASKKGNYSIRIDHLDGLFDNQSILIEDKELNIIQDLKTSPYVFNTKVGEFNNRFAIRYGSKTLSVNENKTSSNTVAIYYIKNDKMLNIINNNLDVSIQKVNLFNILGQKVNYWKIDNQVQQEIQLPIKNINSGVYIAKLSTSKGEFTKKIIIP